MNMSTNAYTADSSAQFLLEALRVQSSWAVCRDLRHGLAIAHREGIHMFFSEDDAEAELEPVYNKKQLLSPNVALFILDGLPWGITTEQLLQKGYVLL
jgi:hypothetical protein